MDAADTHNGNGFVFIVGIARTGSKIYMSMLNRYADIDVVNELHYLAPVYIRRDFVRTVQRHLGPRPRNDNVGSLVRLMFSGTLHGTFWESRTSTNGPHQRISDLDPATLARHLSSAPLSWRHILGTLLREHARTAGKSRPGAKFPVDISRVEVLRRWFPEARFVHLIRDPRAIHASMLAREAGQRAGASRPTRRAVLRRLGYLTLQYRRAARLHRRLIGSGTYHLARFEDMVGNPRRTIPDLCTFLGIDTAEGMFHPPMKDSSFHGDSGNPRLDRNTLDAWRSRLGCRERRVIERLLDDEMRLFGYSAMAEG